MTTFASLTITGVGLLLSFTGVSSNLSAGAEDFSIPWAISGAGGAGTLATNQPIPLAHEALSGAGSGSYSDQLYGHLHLFPGRLDLGLLVGDQTRSVEVWNARFDAQALTLVQPASLDGVSWVGDASPMAAQTSRYWQVTVAGAGSATLDGTLTWHFAAELPMLPVTATRLVIITHPPDWSNPVSEGFAYRTAITVSRNQREQRSALRATPRRSCAYTPLVQGMDQTKLAHQLFAWSARPWAVPIWQDAMLLGLSLAAGAAAIPLTTTARDFAQNQLVMLWSDPSTWEMVQIQSLTSSLLTLVRPTTLTWGVNARVIPIRPGWLAGGLQSVRHAASLSHWPLSWSLDPITGLAPGRMAASGLPTYQGYEVLTTRPNAGEDLSPDASRAVEVVDSDVGPTDLRDLSGFESWGRPYTWTLQGHSAFAAFLGWLEARRGQAVPFWLPTWTADLEQTANMGASDTVIQVANTGYHLYVAQDPTRRDLIFWPMGGGSPLFRRIVDSAINSDGTESLTLDSSFGSIKAVGAFQGINFLTKVRLDHDELTVNWLTNDLAMVHMRLREVPA